MMPSMPLGRAVRSSRSAALGGGVRARVTGPQHASYCALIAPIAGGSAKSGQVVGWVMSLMTRFGCRDRDLVVEAIAAWAPWARRMRLMVRLRRAAMISGPLAVRSWWRSSSKTTSRTDVEPVLDSPVPLDPGGNLLRLGLLHGQ